MVGKPELPHGSNMKRNTIVSLLIATLALGMQPAGAAQNVDKEVIRQVEVALSKAGLYVGNTDGEFTGDTRLALQTFQSRNDLSVTGTITPEVLKALGLE
jgi:peptidoglycan hydrolase-like protein with peptidoglycan-binding domain